MTCFYYAWDIAVVRQNRKENRIQIECYVETMFIVYAFPKFCVYSKAELYFVKISLFTETF